MKDYKISFNESCPCTQKDCPIKNNCVLCISNHLEHKKHIPECVQNLLRQEITSLAKKLELKVSDERPTKMFWDKFDKKKFLEKSLNKHKKKNI